jgi:hypothetical protein
MTTRLNKNRRKFLMTSAGGAAAAGLAGLDPSALAKGKPLPGYASWKDEAKLIVHSSNTMETVRGAQGTSVITANDVLFVRNNLTPPDAAAEKNADAWQVLPREELAAQIWHDVARIAGIAEPLPPWQIVRERRATFAATPQENAKRPGAATRFSNLALAGDWTATGLPATIEGAIRSGQRAADLIAGKA